MLLFATPPQQKSFVCISSQGPYETIRTTPFHSKSVSDIYQVDKYFNSTNSPPARSAALLMSDANSHSQPTAPNAVPNREVTVTWKDKTYTLPITEVELDVEKFKANVKKKIRLPKNATNDEREKYGELMEIILGVLTEHYENGNVQNNTGPTAYLPESLVSEGEVAERGLYQLFYQDCSFKIGIDRKSVV